MKLSVIVPIYNAEKQLRRCLDSLLNQGMDSGEYEVLCINDGSTDHSLQILEHYGAEYPQVVRVLTQENRGVVCARNRGIDEAKGEIVTCCDSDDYLIPGSYRYLLDHFWEDNVDVLRFHSITLDRYVKKKWKETNDPSGNIMYEGLGREVFQHPFFASLCTHLYRKSFLDAHRLRLPNMIMDEDRVFNLLVYMRNPYVRACTSCVYRYTVEDSQTTSIRDVNRVRCMLPDFLYEFSLCNKYLNEFEETEVSLYNYLSQRRFFRTNAFFSRLLSARLSRKEWQSYVAQLLELKWLPIPYGGVSAGLIRLISTNYSFYSISSCLFSTIFVPYILPLIPRN